MIMLSAWILPVAGVNSGFNGSFADGLGVWFIYSAFAGGLTFIQIFFEPEIYKWSDFYEALGAGVEENPEESDSDIDDESQP